jgi:hypothetical protein
MRGWGGVEGGRGEPGIYAKKEAGKLPREEGSDCIFEADSPGSIHRRGAQEAPVRVLIP